MLHGTYTHSPRQCLRTCTAVRGKPSTTQFRSAVLLPVDAGCSSSSSSRSPTVASLIISVGEVCVQQQRQCSGGGSSMQSAQVLAVCARGTMCRLHFLGQQLPAARQSVCWGDTQEPSRHTTAATATEHEGDVCDLSSHLLLRCMAVPLGRV